jgi:hypothetical protein
LRSLERHLSSDAVISETAFDPDAHEPRLLRVLLDAGRYPVAVSSARLDVRWFTTGDFSMHHVEQHDGNERWECRWDRHPNARNTRLHFHEPPAGVDVSDLELSSLHPLDVYSTVLTALDQRIETLWSAR